MFIVPGQERSHDPVQINDTLTIDQEILQKINGASGILIVRRWLKFVVGGAKQAVVISKKEVSIISMQIQVRSMPSSWMQKKTHVRSYKGRG